MAIAALFACTSAALSVLGYRWWGGFMFGLALALAIVQWKTGIWE